MNLPSILVPESRNKCVLLYTYLVDFQNILYQWDISFMLWSWDQKKFFFLWHGEACTLLLIWIQIFFAPVQGPLPSETRWHGHQDLTSFFQSSHLPNFFTYPLVKDTELFITVRISTVNTVPLLGDIMRDLVKFSLRRCQKG